MEDELIEVERDKARAHAIAWDIHFVMNNFHCTSCDKWYSKGDFADTPICPECRSDLR
jgi:Zn finger protein HypA/HybF involved in hydrogenase expression